ncbi:MAG: hypothetical protein IT378_12660 [Sandaracinaceae bacterium]|nr:hypothetical protein [Sandaracinaceae bacterium]
MMLPTLNEDRWPIVIVRWPRELSGAEIDAHFAQIGALAQRRERFVVVLDMLESGTPSATQRAHAARELKALYPTLGSYVVGVAHVIASPLTRGLLTAVYWLAPPPFQTAIVATRADAVRWAESRLARTTPTHAQ